MKKLHWKAKRANAITNTYDKKLTKNPLRAVASPSVTVAVAVTATGGRVV